MSAAQNLAQQCFAGGVGCGISGFLTNPCDVVKIRNQQYGGQLYGTFTGTFRQIIKDEGANGLLKGAKASVLREATYSSIRMGFYEPIKYALLATVVSDEKSPLLKWSSAFLSGAIGSAIFNPVDLVKVRFQSQLPHESTPYHGKISRALSTIFQERGIKGLYAGTSATVIRAAFLTSAQLGTYDIVKNNLLVGILNFDKEANSTHFVGSLITSIAATTAANPADVVKTRAMNCKIGDLGSFGHARLLYRHEGLGAFMKGWCASYCRIGPHTIISFVIIEKVRQLIGLATY